MEIKIDSKDRKELTRLRKQREAEEREARKVAEKRRLIKRVEPLAEKLSSLTFEKGVLERTLTTDWLGLKEVSEDAFLEVRISDEMADWTGATQTREAALQARFVGADGKDSLEPFDVLNLTYQSSRFGDSEAQTVEFIDIYVGSEFGMSEFAFVFDPEDYTSVARATRKKVEQLQEIDDVFVVPILKEHSKRNKLKT